jgi:hypothetical protein
MIGEGKRRGGRGGGEIIVGGQICMTPIFKKNIDKDILFIYLFIYYIIIIL